MFGPLEVDAGGTPLGHRDLGGIKPKQLFEIMRLDRGRTVAASWSCPGATTTPGWPTAARCSRRSQRSVEGLPKVATPGWRS
jgi:hypothetical protein